ncbi:MAG: hypothetical protein AAF497_00230 [Planctomycetota bacterium]
MELIRKAFFGHAIDRFTRLSNFQGYPCKESNVDHVVANTMNDTSHEVSEPARKARSSDAWVFGGIMIGWLVFQTVFMPQSNTAT